MGRRKSTFSIFRWFYNNFAIVFGIIPQSQRRHRILTKRCNVKLPKKKLQTNMNTNANDKFNNISILNHRSIYDVSDSDQQQIICILAENEKIVEFIQYLLMKYESILKNSRIIDLHDLVKMIQTTKIINIPHEDASTMTNIDEIFHQTISYTNLITQSENKYRLKALKFIKIFIEKKKEDFFKYLINEEHICHKKTSMIYQIINEFLNIIYQSEYIQKEKVL